MIAWSVRWGGHIDRRIRLERHRCRRLAPFGQRRDDVAGLDLVDRIVVGGAVGLGPPDDPGIRRWRLDPLGILGQLEFVDEAVTQIRPPADRGNQEMPCLGSGGPPSWRRKNIGPHVEHRQEVVPTSCVGDRDDHRFLAEIEPGARVERIEVGPHHRLHVRRRKSRNVGKMVHGPAESRVRAHIRQLPAGNIHADERIKIEIGFHSDCVRFLRGDRWRRLRGRISLSHCRCQRQGEYDLPH